MGGTDALVEVKVYGIEIVHLGMDEIRLTE